jgi:hypothetical protein
MVVRRMSGVSTTTDPLDRAARGAPDWAGRDGVGVDVVAENRFVSSEDHSRPRIVTTVSGSAASASWTFTVPAAPSLVRFATGLSRPPARRGRRRAGSGAAGRSRPVPHQSPATSKANDAVNTNTGFESVSYSPTEGDGEPAMS